MTTYIKSKVYKITARTRPSTTVRGWNGITQPTPSRNGTETQSKRVSSTQTNHSVIWSQRAIRRRHHDGDGHPHGLTMDSHTTTVRGGRGTAAETQSPYKGSRTTAAHKKRQNDAKYTCSRRRGAQNQPLFPLQTNGAAHCT